LHADVRQAIRKGNALVKKGDLSGARVEFEQAAIEAPEAPFIPYNIANTYLLEGKFDEAKKQYERAMTLTQQPDLQSKNSLQSGTSRLCSRRPGRRHPRI